MTRRRSPLALLASSFLALLFLVPSARADVIRLRTGEAIKGQPSQERSDESRVAIEDYLTGGWRHIAWEALDPADRDRIQEDWGWKLTTSLIIPGHRVTVALAGGESDEVLGVVESQDDRVVRLRRNGEVLEIPRANVTAIEEEPLDVRQVWTPEQLMDRLRQVMRDQGTNVDQPAARDAWSLAEYARTVGALEEAKRFYEICAADEGFLKKDLARQRLERIQVLLQDQAALATLKDARMKLQMHLFKRTREILDGFAEKHPEASEEVTRVVEKTRGDLAQERTAWLQTIARRNFVKIVQDLIEDKVREKDVQVTDVTAWTRRDLPDAAFARLVDKYMKRYDEDTTPEEARSFWDGRKKSRWDRVSYGAGTFVVDPPKIKPPQRRAGGGGGRRPGSGGGGGAAVQIPKPPTRDQWWEGASPKERTQWVLAYFVERSELFELGEREYRPCSVCNGVGLLSKTFQTGEVLSYLCTRCGGAQQDVIVKYR